MRTTISAYDIVGVGFGPSNLALAIALAENDASAERPYSRLFFEQKEQFSWHSGMLLEGATMQVSFLKDLVTQRDPTSKFSFLCYLKAQGRLADFINLKDFFPTRLEFHDYFRWCSDAVSQNAKYRHKVVAIDGLPSAGGLIDKLVVTVRDADGEMHRHTARACSLAMGIAPRMPKDMPHDPRIWHTSQLIGRCAKLAPKPNPRFAVIGSGQSAAEAVQYLIDLFPDARVHAVLGRLGFVPSDNSPFVNRVFDPEMVDRLHAMSPELRAHVRDAHSATNYGVVDLAVIESLYRRWYADRVAGRERLVIESLSRLAAVETRRHGLGLVLQAVSGPGERTIDVDYIICATGYDPISPEQLLSPGLRALIERDAQDRPLISRDYRLKMRRPCSAPIYIQGDCEASHGLSATLLSNLASRSGEIRDSLLAHLDASSMEPLCESA